jgi:hypothetical protein
VAFFPVRVSQLIWKHAIFLGCPFFAQQSIRSLLSQTNKGMFSNSKSASSAGLQVSKHLFDAKDLLTANRPKEAMKSCREALSLSAELSDKRARRAVLRVKVCCHRFADIFPFYRGSLAKGTPNIYERVP